MMHRTHLTWRGAAALVVLLAVYGMIFSFSAQDAATSSRLSGRLASLFASPDSGSFARFDHLLRKGAHAAEFALLYLLWHLFLADLFPSAGGVVLFLLPLLFTGLSAGADEWSQRFSAGRACQFTDVLIDLAGASAMGLLLLWLRRIRRRVT